MGGAAVGTRGVVVGGGAHQRVAERQPVAVEHHDAVLLGHLQLGHAEAALLQGGEDAHEVAVGLRGRHEQGVEHRLVEALEQEVDDALARRPDRQRIGQLGAPGALVGVEQVGRLDEHQRDAPTCRDELAAHVHGADAGVTQYRVGHVVGDHVEVDDGAGVGVRVAARPPRRHDDESFELQSSRDVRQRPPCRQVDPLEVVDDDDDRGGLGGVDQQVARGEGDGERLDGLVGALDGERRPHRRRSRRCQAFEAVEDAVEQLGQARPRQLDLGLHALHADDPAVGLVDRDDRRRLVDDGRLADPGVADDRERPALADGGARSQSGDGVDDVLTAMEQRQRGRRGELGHGRSSKHGVSPMRGSPPGRQIICRSFDASRSEAAEPQLERSRHGRGCPNGSRAGPLAGPLAGRGSRDRGRGRVGPAPARRRAGGGGAGHALHASGGRQPGADRRDQSTGGGRRSDAD